MVFVQSNIKRSILSNLFLFFLFCFRRIECYLIRYKLLSFDFILLHRTSGYLLGSIKKEFTVFTLFVPSLFARVRPLWSLSRSFNPTPLSLAFVFSLQLLLFHSHLISRQSSLFLSDFISPSLYFSLSPPRL